MLPGKKVGKDRGSVITSAAHSLILALEAYLGKIYQVSFLLHVLTEDTKKHIFCTVFEKKHTQANGGKKNK